MIDDAMTRRDHFSMIKKLFEMKIDNETLLNSHLKICLI